jgi:alanine dehydrogenase
MKTKTLLLTEAEVESLMDWKTAVRLAEEELRQQGKGNVLMPPKQLLNLRSKGLDSYSNSMPAYLEYLGVAGIKWGGGYGENNKTGNLPYMMQVAVLNSPTTGEIHCIMGATWLTTTKTGSEAALSGKYLAKKDDLVVAVLGAGLQGSAGVHCWLALDALGDVSVKEMRIVDLNQATAERVAAVARVAHPGKSIRTFNSIQPAVEGAHVIVAATTSTKPIVRRAWVRDDAFTASIGSYPEFDSQIILDADKLVVDNWEQNSHRGEFKDLIEGGKITRDGILGELPDIIAGNVPGRQSSDEQIAASLIGLGSVDLAIGWEIYHRALAKGVGTPYAFL